MPKIIQDHPKNYPKEKICEICGRSYTNSYYQLHDLCGNKKCMNKRFIEKTDHLYGNQLNVKRYNDKEYGAIHKRNEDAYLRFLEEKETEKQKRRKAIQAIKEKRNDKG